MHMQVGLLARVVQTLTSLRCLCVHNNPLSEAANNELCDALEEVPWKACRRMGV